MHSIITGRRPRRASKLMALVLASWLLVAVAQAGVRPRTERASVSVHGRQAAGQSFEAAISARGRFVVFESTASNLVRGDSNGAVDIFGRDRSTGRTARLSVSSHGRQANGSSHLASMSAHGRFVAFESAASNLVPGDSNNATDVFVRDRRTGRTIRASVSVHGRQGNGPSVDAFMSADGRFVTFQSAASNLVRRDSNGAQDVFVRDLRTRRTGRVSLSSKGRQGAGDSSDPAISPHGRLLAFTSDAPNLVRGDSNGASDVFVRDRRTGRTSRVSLSSTGRQANGASLEAEMSPGGRFVAFTSLASNLVPGDTNGVSDVFVRDRRTRRTKRVSVSSSGRQANGPSRRTGSAIAVGRFVGFQSFASNLVRGDTNGTPDAFVSDLAHRTIRRVSVSSAGAQGNGQARAAHVSADGRFAAFYSLASNLVPRDTNSSFDVFVRGPLR